MGSGHLPAQAGTARLHCQVGLSAPSSGLCLSALLPAGDLMTQKPGPDASTAADGESRNPPFPGGDPHSAGTEPPAGEGTVRKSRYDRSIVEGPLLPAVWRIAWPTMLQNIIGGIQGIVDHAMVGHYVGYEGNAAIGISWQIFLVVVVFISSLFTGMSVLVARFAGRDEESKVNRTVYQAFLTAIGLALAMAPAGYFLTPALLALVNAAPTGSQGIIIVGMQFDPPAWNTKGTRHPGGG